MLSRRGRWRGGRYHRGVSPEGKVPTLAIVVSRYNAGVTGRMLRGAVEAYEGAGGRADELTIVEAPGAFELPALALAAARSGRYAGVLAIGCIIRGETNHDEVIAHAVAGGLTGVTLQTGVPVCFGVLTVGSVEQAMARAGGEWGESPNKGREAMQALLETVRASWALGEPHEPGLRVALRASTPDKSSRGAN